MGKSNGQLLSEFAKKNSLTKEKLASLMGVSKSTVYRYENGITDIHPLIIERMNKQYGLKLISTLKNRKKEVTKNITKKEITDTKQSKMNFIERIKYIKDSKNLSIREFESSYGIDYKKATRKKLDTSITVSIKGLRNILSQGYSLDWLFS